MPPVPAMAHEVFLSDMVPNLAAAVPSLTANPNPVNTPTTPPSPAAPQSPLGTSVTNTGRTVSATQAFLDKNPNANFSPPYNPYVPPADVYSFP